MRIHSDINIITYTVHTPVICHPSRHIKESTKTRNPHRPSVCRKCKERSFQTLDNIAKQNLMRADSGYENVTCSGRSLQALLRVDQFTTVVCDTPFTHDLKRCLAVCAAHKRRGSNQFPRRFIACHRRHVDGQTKNASQKSQVSTFELIESFTNERTNFMSSKTDQFSNCQPIYPHHQDDHRYSC